ncbi:tryptophan-rich sensory protein [Mesonia aestuariivivens]|uniref:Tryptophan-rich sensory protein n=1 Tax=Mesonia aestuariivivens TaxID=2796128 RepID=A0ABS6VXK7_9FLAO|nr:tryptophan-rich sensory protein [Mesonia aestuariivivens]MBW2960310.1 tryptophan-rich sensory protein [Mesonia aestuariivivens]
MKLKLLAILNFISVVITLFVSYYTQAIKLNGNTMGSLSSEYFNLFTPAGYAFVIWGIIYLGLLTFSSYQIYQAFNSKNDLKFLQQTKYWFIIANLANAAWVIVWLYEYTGLSIFLMFLILFSLIKIILNTNMERWDAPLKIIAFSWWPICLYSGWIAVATIANISAYLAKIGWSGGIFSETQWTVIMIIVATVLNIVMIYTRNMREFAAVGIWALVAIYMRHNGQETLIANIALGGSILIGINCAYHGFMNRKQSPFYRMMNK